MKYFQLKIFLVLLMSLVISNNLFAQDLLLLMGDDEILTETNQYVKRVNMDAGKMQNKNLLNKFIQISKKENWYNEIKFWTSAQWGIKESEGNVTKQYELNGKDLTTDGFDKRPKKVTEGNVFGIKYDGVNDYSNNSDVSLQHPMSMLIVFKANETNSENILLDSKGNKKHSVSIEKNKDGMNELVIRTAGEIYVKGIRNGINILYIEFNVKESRVFLNGEIEYTGMIGKSEIVGLEVGRGKIKNKTVNFDGIMYETGLINNLISDEARTNLITMLKQVYQVQ